MIRFRLFFNVFAIALIILSCSSENDSLKDPDLNSPPNAGSTQESTIEFLKQNEIKDSIFTINSVVQLNDSSYTLAGGVRYDGNYDKNVLIKLDKYGNREWLEIMEHTSTPRGIEKLFQNGNGYIGYLGSYFGTENSSPLIHFSNTGEVLGEFHNHNMLGLDIIRDENNFVIAGRNQGDLHIQKVTTFGEIIWSRSLQSSSSASSITKLTDGNYISIGGYNFSHPGDYLHKLSPEGQKIWSRHFNGMKVLAISDNGFIAITGRGEELNFARFDEDGNKIWSKELENRSLNDLSTVNIFNYNMEYFVCSYENENFNLNLLVLDPDGNEINLLTIDDLPTANYGAVSKTIDSGIFITRTRHLDQLDFIKLSYETIFTNTPNN
ncbi:hypothetical protein LB467_10885 [Salegentibacter sp. JZCK2]|uniref:hypothetical protein n=1 Tax=Salegentibacter tibetensis TaxID=2873600 RepID=UPI001CCD1D36|nr:hypothetical protein [Salegentibacter tibetensis]MBZ9730191.1 hypothetical protein [Salegentibacter tibetensis]